VFFSEPRRFQETISPSGEWISFLGADERGGNHLWVVRWDHSEAPVRVSNPSAGGVTTGFWLPGDRLVWEMRGTDGQPHYFTGYPTAGNPREIVTGRTDVAGLAGVSGHGDDPNLLLELPGKSSSYPDLYKRSLRVDGGPVKILGNDHRVFAWSFHHDGSPAAGLRWNGDGSKEIVDLEKTPGRVLFHAEAGDDLRLLSATGRDIWILTNKGSECTRVGTLNTETGGFHEVFSDPLGRMDVEGLVMKPSSREPVAVSYPDGTLRWQTADPAFHSILGIARGVEEADEVVSASGSSDGRRWIVTCRKPGHPASIWACEPRRHIFRKLWDERPELASVPLCIQKPYAYPARDGSVIPGFLTLPKTGGAPWPLVVFPHGGPHMRTGADYDGRAQFLASRGYAVLQPNFRGSRGYGKSFMNAGDGQWGTGVMGTDLADGAAELVRQGIAAKGRVAILGGSYGGYAAMAGLCFAPETYAAGVSLFGISDLNEFVSRVPSQWEPFAGDLARSVGNPRTPSGALSLRGRSPLHHVAAVRAPLLIYHGLKDPLIPTTQSRNMARALRSAGKSFEYLAAADEPHGFSRSETEMAVYRAIEIFLHEQVGGETGGEPTAKTCARLEEIRAAGAADLSRDDPPGGPARPKMIPE